jgi:hypothetical protein
MARALKRRRCYLPSCRKWFQPEHRAHYFHHEFCYREALTQYAGSDFPLASDGSRIMSRDLHRGLWNPLWEYRIPGKRATLENRRVLTPVRVGPAQPGAPPAWVETIDGGARVRDLVVITEAVRQKHRPECFCDECVPPARSRTCRQVNRTGRATRSPRP